MLLLGVFIVVGMVVGDVVVLVRVDVTVDCVDICVAVYGDDGYVIVGVEDIIVVVIIGDRCVVRYVYVVVLS